MMQSDFHLDWLQITYEDKSMAENSLIDHPAFEPIGTRKPIRGYNRGVELECGGAIFWHTERSVQGINLMLSGEPLARLRTAIDEFDLLSNLTLYAKKVPRIDIALDIPIGFDFDNWRQLSESGLIKTRMKLGWQLKDKRTDGAGIYWGVGKYSERTVRAYDKGAALPDSTELITRIEMKMKDNAAKACVEQMLTDGIEQGGKRVLDQYWSIEDQMWETLMKEKSDSPIIEPSKHNPNYVKWLMQTVLPSIKTKWSENMHQEGIYNFAEALVTFIENGTSDSPVEWGYHDDKE